MHIILKIFYYLILNYIIENSMRSNYFVYFKSNSLINAIKKHLNSFRILRKNMSQERGQIRKKPFIIICGCTGTGKTKLSIQLAEWLIQNGQKAEIINADSMQVHY